MEMSPQDILARAELICPVAQIQTELDRLGAELNSRFAESHPLVLCVMNGGLFFTGQLLPRLVFPLHLDYLHATRYGNACAGNDLAWKALPSQRVQGRSVLVLDDILDEGCTLAAIKAYLLAQGAKEVVLAVLADKDHGRAKPVTADFVAVTVPDRFVFGCGMDVAGAWRQLPAIYACAPDDVIRLTTA